MNSHTIADSKRQQRSWNSVTLSKLEEKGVRHMADCLICHSFIVRPSRDVTDLLAELEGEGFTNAANKELTDANDTAYVSVDAAKALKLCLDDLNAITDRCVEIAEAHGAE